MLWPVCVAWWWYPTLCDSTDATRTQFELGQLGRDTLVWGDKNSVSVPRPETDDSGLGAATRAPKHDGEYLSRRSGCLLDDYAPLSVIRIILFSHACAHSQRGRKPESSPQ